MMPKITVGTGLALILIGVVGFMNTGAKTALIPAVMGLVIGLAGVIALVKEDLRKHAMHVAVLIGLVGFLMTAKALIKLPVLLSGGTVQRPAAVIAQSVTAILLGIFVGLCVQSFVNARRQRTP